MYWYLTYIRTQSYESNWTCTWSWRTVPKYISMNPSQHKITSSSSTLQTFEGAVVVVVTFTLSNLDDDQFETHDHIPFMNMNAIYEFEIVYRSALAFEFQVRRPCSLIDTDLNSRWPSHRVPTTPSASRPSVTSEGNEQTGCWLR